MHPNLAIELTRHHINELHAEAARHRLVLHRRRAARPALTARGWARLRGLTPSPQPMASTSASPIARPTAVRQAVAELT